MNDKVTASDKQPGINVKLFSEPEDWWWERKNKQTKHKVSRRKRERKPENQPHRNWANGSENEQTQS